MSSLVFVSKSLNTNPCVVYDSHENTRKPVLEVPENVVAEVN